MVMFSIKSCQARSLSGLGAPVNGLCWEGVKSVGLYRSCKSVIAGSRIHQPEGWISLVGRIDFTIWGARAQLLLRPDESYGCERVKYNENQVHCYAPAVNSSSRQPSLSFGRTELDTALLAIRRLG